MGGLSDMLQRDEDARRVDEAVKRKEYEISKLSTEEYERRYGKRSKDGNSERK